MKLGIMQPYFFPYIGYWQLINAVDLFIIYDDVNFIKGGWVTRNMILNNGAPSYFSLHTFKASPFVPINRVEVAPDRIKKRKLIEMLRYCYRKAPCFLHVFPMIERMILNKERNLAAFLTDSISEICKYLNIDTEIRLSSEIDKNSELKGRDKVIDICKRMQAARYYNAIGGQAIYLKEDFHQHGIALNFLRSKPIKYRQFNNEFCPNLSIIDLLMFNPVDDIKKMLLEYELI